MSSYIYTLTPPGDSLAENKRLGYRTPRSVLLPPYFQLNAYFVEFMDAIDAVFEPLVDQKTEILGDLRNMWVTNPELENNQIANSQLIPFEAWSQPEREILVKQVNMLGMKLQSAGVLSDISYQSIARWVGMYWFGKGTRAFIDFINYCLSSALSVTQLWTEDYVHFVPAGDSSIGTPIWEGGTWYPTTTVSITATGGLQTIDVQTLVIFFYEIANYNLVLQDVALSYSLPISDHDGGTVAEIVAMGLFIVQQIPLSNLYSFGVDPPPISVTTGIPTAAYTSNPGATDLSATFMLAAPDSWLLDDQNRLFPLYSPINQVSINSSSTTTNLCGGPAVAGINSAIYGLDAWIEIPSGALSTGRIPGYTAIPTAKTAALDRYPTHLVGRPIYILCNPAGFAEFVPGSGIVSPYWLPA